MAASQGSRRFARIKEQYSSIEKRELGELVNKHKEKYDNEVKELEGKTRYDYKRKKHVQLKPQQGFLAAAVREFYTDLSKAKHHDPKLVNALKFAKRCYENYLANDFGEEPSKKRFRESGAGRK